MQKKICFIVPYFGTLPEYFQVWLDTCRTNPTIDWLVFTDDSTEFNVPLNVKIEYTTFAYIQNVVQKCYDFEISLLTPYKLCDYKIAYGEIFSDYLVGYDYWGFCDIDVIWGNIRKFFSDDLLDAYDKIGVQGHCTIFRNTYHVNTLYRNKIEGFDSIKKYFQREGIGCLDKDYIAKAFNVAGLKVYEETIYAGLHKYFSGFYLQGKGTEEDEYSKYNLFLWDNGNLIRYFLKDGEIASEDYLYIHFFCRPMKNMITKMDRILIYPDCYESFYDDIDKCIIKKLGTKSKLSYYIRVYKQNKDRLSFARIVNFIKMKCNYKYIR